MKNWTFLIQKEGEKTWKTAVPQMTLEAGRYRVVVHSQRIDEIVEVRLSYRPESDSSKSRSQKRSRQTNGEGLMVVIPFTTLKPGFWDIKCSGEIWEESLQLQVISSEIKVGSDLLLNEKNIQIQEREDAETEKNGKERKLPSPSPFSHLQLTLHQTRFSAGRGEGVNLEGRIDNLRPTNPHEIFQGTLEYQLRNPQTADTLLEVEKSLTHQTLPLEFSHTLKVPLHCATHLLLGEVILYCQNQERTRQSFTITLNLGELFQTMKPESESEEETPSPETEAVSLNLDLLKFTNQPKKDSQFQPTSKSALPPKIAQPSPENNSRSPQLPNFFLSSPSDAEPQSPSDLEVNSLEVEESDAIAEISPPPKLDAIPPLAEQLQPSSLPNPEVESLNVSEKEEEPHSSSSSSPEDQKFKALKTQNRFLSRLTTLATDGPLLTGSQSQEQEVFVFTPPVEEEVTSAPEALEIEEKSPSLEEVEPTGMEETFSLWEDPETENTDWQKNPELLVTDKPLGSSGESADLEKNLELLMAAEKFLQVASPPPSTQPPDNGASLADDDPPQPFSSVPDPPLSPAVDWQSQEIVVEDDELLRGQDQILSDTSGFPYPPELINTTSSPEAQTISSSPQSIPTPILILHQSELVAGNSAIIRVKLPSYSGSIYVKLWMQDLQTRMLIDGPHSLVNLIPNQEGELETLTELTVPLGSLDVRLAAIAIDPKTKIESHKAILDRVVLPPDSPPMSLEEFEI